MKRFMFLLAGLLAATLAFGQVKVVYHLTEGIPQASRAMSNIRNHLDADPTVKIVVIANGDGINFLLEGAKTTSGQPFTGAIGELSGRGVTFEVCNNTLTSRKIDKNLVAMEAKTVPSGVAEAALLQSRDGYAYLHP